MNSNVRELVRGASSIAVALATFVTVPDWPAALPLAIFAVIGYQTLFDRTWGKDEEVV